MNSHLIKYPVQYTIFTIFTIQLLNGFFLSNLYQYSPSFFWVFDAFQFVFLPALFLYLLYTKYSITPSSYGLVIPDNKHQAKELLLIIIYCTLLLQLFSFVSYEMTKAFIAKGTTGNYQSVIPTGSLQIPVIIYMSLTAAIVEEIFYRGLPLLILKNIFTGKKLEYLYIYTTTFIFTLVHWENGFPDIVSSFIYGIFAASFYLQFKRLIPIIVAHFVINMVVFL